MFHMTSNSYNDQLPPQLIQSLMDGPIHRQQVWEGFLQRLDQMAKVHGSRGKALRHKLKVEDCEEDLGLFCFLNGLDIMFIDEIEKIIIEA